MGSGEISAFLKKHDETGGFDKIGNINTTQLM